MIRVRTVPLLCALVGAQPIWGTGASSEQRGLLGTGPGMLGSLECMSHDEQMLGLEKATRETGWRVTSEAGCDRRIPLNVWLQKAELKTKGWNFEGGNFSSSKQAFWP